MCIRDSIRGEKGTLIMFICNHCPYVKAVIKDIVDDCRELEKIGIKSVAICSNDVKNYPEDSFENMDKFSKNNKLALPHMGFNLVNHNKSKIWNNIPNPSPFYFLHFHVKI